MKIDLLFGAGVLTLPAAVLEKLPRAKESELKVLLLLGDPLLRQNTDPETIAARTGLSAEQVLLAIEFWRGSGLLSYSGAQESASTAASTSASVAPVANATPVTPAPESNRGANITIVRSDDGMPHYTAEEIQRIFDENRQLSGMIDECQNIFGKLFNPTEINKLMALNEYFRLDCEYILLLCYYCKKIGKTSIPYLDKLARSLYGEGIDTVDALGDRLGEMEAAADLGNYYRNLLGAGKRAFTEKESRFLAQWVKWNISPDVLRLAYEVTVDCTGAPSMPYTNKVLSNWKEAGYTTAEQVKSAMEDYRKKKESRGAESVGNSFATDEFFEAALRHGLALHEGNG